MSETVETTDERMARLRERVRSQAHEAARATHLLLAHRSMDAVPSRGSAPRASAAQSIEFERLSGELVARAANLARLAASASESGPMLSERWREARALAEIALDASGAADSIHRQLHLAPALRAVEHALTTLEEELTRAARRSESMAYCAAATEAVLREITTGGKLAPESLAAIARRIAEDLELFGVPMILPAREPDPARHAVISASIAAYLVTQDDRWRPHRDSVVIAALVQDAGMTRIARETWDHPGPLSAAARHALAEHPMMGMIFLEGLEGFPPELARAAGRHHERLHGSGYPGRLRGEELDAADRLLALADVLAALVQHRRHRPAASLGKAITEVLRLADAGQLDSAWARGLLNLSIYPVGSIVELSTGERAEVVATQEARERPYLATLPIVRLLRDAHGQWIPSSRFINLAQCSDIRVVRAIG